jgi:hypothetical protein
MTQREGILNTLSRYSWYYDSSLRAVGIGECFTLDAKVRFYDSGLIVGRTAVEAELRRRRGTYAGDSMPWHLYSNVLILDQTEEWAQVRTSYTFVDVSDGQPLTIGSVGYYEDEFRLEDGAWRVDVREVAPRRRRTPGS